MNKFIIISFVFIICACGCVSVEPDFKDKVSEADRIVVRDGGNICCDKITPPATMEVWFEIEDCNKVKEVYDHIVFKGDIHKNTCQCCGKPRIEWYKGTTLLAVTTVMHGKAMMIERNQVIALTPESKEWIRDWLLRNGVSEDRMR